MKKKEIQNENAIEDLVWIDRLAKIVEDCTKTINEKYQISEESAEALAYLTLPQLTGLRFDSIQDELEYNTLAVECLQPLIEHQSKHHV